jgi:hypothetical protein
MRRPNHAARFEGIAKTKLQASRASDTETLQSQVNKVAKKRLSLSGLKVLHGRLIRVGYESIMRIPKITAPGLARCSLSGRSTALTLRATDFLLLRLTIFALRKTKFAIKRVVMRRHLNDASDDEYELVKTKTKTGMLARHREYQWRKAELGRLLELGPIWFAPAVAN